MSAAVKNTFPDKPAEFTAAAAMFAEFTKMLNPNRAARASLLLGFILLTSNAAFAQNDEEKPAAREILSLDFQTQRPRISVNGGAAAQPKISSARRRKSLAVVTGSKRRYKLINRAAAAVKPKITAAVKAVKETLKTEELGVTFWRLRPAEADEADAPTFAVNVGSAAEQWTAERVGSTTQFRQGDRVRLTVESSRSGFLYIVNREFYTDGTTAEADLIFPTLRTRGGDNRVTAGSLIEIPATTDSVPYFTIKPRRADYAGEEIAVIISPIKIPGIEPEMRARQINRETVGKWLREWGTTLDVYDAEDGEGIAYTAVEAQAAAAQSRALTQEEPLPQTIYRLQARVGAPLAVLFRMNAEPR